MADKIKNGCSVLLLCDTNIYNAFPFLVYYLTKFVSDEYPTIDKAVGAIFNMIDKRGYFSRFEEISNVMKNCLTDAYN